MKRLLKAFVRKWMVCGLTLAMVLATAGCAGSGSTEGGTTGSVEAKERLVIFAAASLTESLTTIQEVYEKGHPEVKLSFHFDSSGTLKKQIQEGAECDIFISAAPKQMNQLDGELAQDEEKNPDGLDLLMEGTRKNLLENKVALVVPEGNPKGITGYEDLMNRLSEGDVLLAMGNADVPVGQYTQKIMAYFGVDEETVAAKGAVTYGTNVKDVTAKVSEASVDCGIVYATDAAAAGLTVVDTATKEMCGQVIYPIAVLKETKQETLAKEFAEYLTGQEAGEIFEAAGFSRIQ